MSINIKVQVLYVCLLKAQGRDEAVRGTIMNSSIHDGRIRRQINTHTAKGDSEEKTEPVIHFTAVNRSLRASLLPVTPRDCDVNCVSVFVFRSCS